MAHTVKISMGDLLSYGCIVFAALCSFNDSLNTYALYGTLPLAFLWCFIKYSTLKVNIAMRFLCLLYVWICICYFFAQNSELANHEIHRIIGCLILCYSVGSLAKKQKLIPWLYILFLILLISAWAYAKEHILSVFDFGEERLNDEKLNANTLAYYTFYVTVALFILGEIIDGEIRKVCRALFLCTILLSFMTAIYTASRQVLIIQVPLLSFLLWDRYLRNREKKLLILTVVFVTVGYLFTSYGETIYEQSLLKKRSENEIQDDSRTKIAKECIELWVQRPMFGYGPGNSVAFITTHHFAHNTFLELLVNTGLVGSLIFAYMIMKFLRVQYYRWKNTEDQLFLTFLIFGIFWLVDQVFYVFYIDLWLMSFFILVASHSDTYYQNLLQQDNISK